MLGCWLDLSFHLGPCWETNSRGTNEVHTVTKLKIDMCDFLRTGNFGPIRLGMTKAQVEHLLGRPQSWGGHFPWWNEEQREQDRSYNEHPYWKYDDMEFHFGDKGQQLFLIWCDYLERLKSKGDTFYLDRWVFATHPLTREQLEQALMDEDIDYTHTKLEPFGKLVLASGVEISYEYDDIGTVSAIGNYDESYVGAPDDLSEEAT